MAPEGDFWRGKRVLLTGHTGFKGAWLAIWLQELGAEVTGFANGVPTDPSIFELAGLRDSMETVWADIRDPEAVAGAVEGTAAEVVIHMAAQPFVRRSFLEPRETYETNVMGTVNLLDAVRNSGGVRVVVNVTSDKCYENLEQGRPFREDDAKGGHDPYSNSKGCAELVADAYWRSYFRDEPNGPRLASGRAGNVIGGGDWGEDRLIPDVVRASAAGETVLVRSPRAIRPWQHVLNPLSGYLLLAERLWEEPADSLGWNFGPAESDALEVAEVLGRLDRAWPGGISWEVDDGKHPHEAQTLLLDSSKAREQLSWAPGWDLARGIEATAEWYAGWQGGEEVRELTVGQLRGFPVSGA
ncbi:MAG: CDP-glucose 4,6-dehydratase [Solirubrobacterales bacterium]